MPILRQIGGWALSQQMQKYLQEGKGGNWAEISVDIYHYEEIDAAFNLRTVNKK